MSEIVNFTRLTTSDKLQDRFLTCQVYQPADPEQRQSGLIFSQIEILNPWFPNAQIGQTIINTVIREYYRGTDTSELNNFEATIKKVNEALAQIAQNGETDWIGKLSGIIALVNGKEIHIAQTGRSEAYLYRGGKVNHITEGLGSEEAKHPLKTFSNLTSGTMQKDDRIIIANGDFFKSVAPNELKIIITSFPPTVAAIESAKILKSHNKREGNAVFLELTTKADLANLPPEQKVETVYIDRSTFNPILLSRYLWRSTIAPAGSAIKHGVSSVFHYGRKKLGPSVKGTLTAVKKGSKAALEKSTHFGKKNGDTPVKILEEKDLPPAPATQGALRTGPPIESAKNEAGARAPKVKKTFLKVKNKIRRVLIQLGFYTRKKSKMVLIIFAAVILILGLALTISFLKGSQKKRDQSAKDALNKIVSLEAEAALASSNNSASEALQKYKEIISLADGISQSKYASEAKDKADKAKTKIQEITHLIIAKPQNSIEVGDSVASLEFCQDALWATLENGAVKERQTNLPGFVDFANLKFPSKVVASSCISETGSLAYVSENKALSTIALNKKELQTETVKLNSGGVIKGFVGNIYQLDQASNQVWKIALREGHYTADSAFIQQANTSLADAVDLAVDGSVYVLAKNGSISRFSRGELINNFEIALPGAEKVDSWAKIFTDENSDNLFAVIGDTGQVRVVEASKNGAFVGQYLLDGVSSLQEITANLATREFYVLQDKNVLTYKFSS